jgi:hypothetical protein
MDGIASLTWRRPRLVLAAVGVFVAVAIGFGHNVTSHLTAAGFTDSATQSERSTSLLLRTLGYDPSPQLAILIESKTGGPLNLNDPATTAEINRLAARLRAVRYVGRVIDPPTTPGAGDQAARSCSPPI